MGYPFSSCAQSLFCGQGRVYNISQLFRSARDFVLPERCASCGVITPSGGTFCSLCWHRVRFLTPPWCAACAAPLPFETENVQLCAHCLASPPIHDGIRAVTAYNDVTAQIILRLKYGGRIGLAKMIAAQLKRHLPEDPAGVLVVPVPLHWTRLWSRSFNQSALIGAVLAHDNGMDYTPDLLVRTKRTPSLRGMSQTQRKRAVAKAFVLNPKRQICLSARQVILVDDVYTTGATTNACIKILKKAGAQSVQIFCWARVLRGDDPGDYGDVLLQA